MPPPLTECLFLLPLIIISRSFFPEAHPSRRVRSGVSVSGSHKARGASSSWALARPSQSVRQNPGQHLIHMVISIVASHTKSDWELWPLRQAQEEAQRDSEARPPSLDSWETTASDESGRPLGREGRRLQPGGGESEQFNGLHCDMASVVHYDYSAVLYLTSSRAANGALFPPTSLSLYIYIYITLSCSHTAHTATNGGSKKNGTIGFEGGNLIFGDGDGSDRTVRLPLCMSVCVCACVCVCVTHKYILRSRSFQERVGWSGSAQASRTVRESTPPCLP